MFARYYLYLDRPLQDVAAAVVAWVGGGRTVAETTGGRALLAEAGVALVGVQLHRSTDLVVGPPNVADAERGVTLPVRWRPVDGPPVLPDMEGDLSLEPYGSGRTQITLNASYRAPCGQLGRILDRALVQRIADAIVRDGAIRIETTIEDLFHAPPARTPDCEYG
jgi:hypothetical protein